MINLKVIDLISSSNAILQPFGLKVFEEVRNYWEAGETVRLSFEGIKNVTSGFCHASIGNLYKYDSTKAKNALEIVDLYNDIWMEKIIDAISLASDSKKASDHLKNLECTIS